MIKKVAVLSLCSSDSGGIYQYTLSLLEALKNIESKHLNFVQVRYPEFPKFFDKDIIVQKKKQT